MSLSVGDEIGLKFIIKRHNLYCYSILCMSVGRTDCVSETITGVRECLMHAFTIDDEMPSVGLTSIIDQTTRTLSVSHRPHAVGSSADTQ